MAAGRSGRRTLALAIVLLGTADAPSADVAKCRRTIAGEFGELTVARTSLLRKRHDQVVRGKRSRLCGDGIIVAPEICEPGRPCGRTNVWVACAVCLSARGRRDRPRRPRVAIRAARASTPARS